MSRKYRQQGYMSEEGEGSAQQKGQPRSSREGPRSPKMTNFQQIFRCKSCGKAVPPSFEEILCETNCPNCQSSLHTCTNCVFFDPAGRFECTKPITRRVTPKDSANKCRYFEARTTVEKQTTSNSEHEDPRDAFERLFKS